MPRRDGYEEKERRQAVARQCQPPHAAKCVSMSEMPSYFHGRKKYSFARQAKSETEPNLPHTG